MVYISKVYTKFGDEGQTMLASGETVGKDSLRVRAYGEVDELNATLGLVRLELGRETLIPEHPDLRSQPPAAEFVATLDGELGRIQQELFNLGAELATSNAAEGGARLKVEQRHIDALEQSIDGYNESLEPLRSFILPGGGPTATAAHLARTVCRRAERELVGLARDEPVRSEARIYLNRLSDWLFVIARATAKHFGHAEVLWDQRRT
jgi:cob(I)alamin adenosyltransferase